MALIIGRGGENDPLALKLETLQRNWIENEVTPERSPDEMRAAIALAMAGRPNVVLRSASSRYDCMGLPFASRRTSIAIDQWDLIRVDDRYRQIQEGEALAGDVVIYRRDGFVNHVGVVNDRHFGDNGLPIITVLSQWGYDGEYWHPVDQVPDLYGNAVEYWTDRKPHP
jgi:hypothetical protein